MSEAQKPVEEPVVVPTPAEAPVVEPAAESAAVETAAEPATETPAVTEPATETAAAEPAKEVVPVEEGVLGYKGPGLFKSLISQKKFFWFGTEPVETKHLSSYLRGEKPEVANHNAAWSSHTGKGLLYFSKKPAEKAAPAGIINLSEATEVAKEGTVDFVIHIGGHKHTFQTSGLADRDNWVAVLKTKIAEAKELAESVISSETYKKSHSSLSKPVVAVAAVAAPKKSTEVKKEEKAEAKEEKKEEEAEAKEEKKEEKKARKSRSASRKRNSIFGPFLGKKEEAKEEAAPAAAPATEEAAPVAEPVAVEAPVVEEPVVAAPVEEAAPSTEAARPVASKRNSIFGTLKSTFSSPKKAETEAAPAVPAKDAEPVSETAPVIPAVETSEPLATSVASPATVPTETTETPVTNGETKAETPVVKSDKRKSSLPFGFGTKKEKATTSDEEGEKPKSPFAKLRATVKGKSSPKAEKAAEKAAEPAAVEPAAEAKAEETTPAVEETPTVVEPVVSEPIPAAHSSTPQVSATA